MGFKATLMPQLFKILMIGSEIHCIYGTIAKPLMAESPAKHSCQGGEGTGPETGKVMH